MPIDQRTCLANVRRFDQLVAYLRDEMGWPIESDDFEELTFEYTPEELGIEAARGPAHMFVVTEVSASPDCEMRAPTYHASSTAK